MTVAESTKVPPTGKVGMADWWLVVSVFVFLLIFSGMGFYSLGLFVKPLEDEFGWSRASIGAMATLYFLMGGIMGPWVGRGVDTYGARKVLLLGVLALSAGLVVLSRTQALWQLYLGSAIYCAGLTAIGPVTGGSVISKSFREGRGTAMGVAMTGIALGGMLLVPGLGYLIAKLGWRNTYLVMAAISLVVVGLIAQLIKDRPHSRDATAPTPLAAKGHAGGPPDRRPKGTVRGALSGITFWLISVAFVAGVMGVATVVFNVVPYLTDQGISRELASTALGLAAGVGGLGKLAFGYLTDRAPAKYVAGLAFFLQALGVLLLLRIDSPAGVWPFVIVYGFSMGANIALLPLVLGQYYGLASFATILGTSAMIQNLVNAGGPLLNGLIYDATGNYTGVFALSLIMYLVALTSILALRGSGAHRLQKQAIEPVPPRAQAAPQH